MFNFGLAEILIILVVVLLAFGPEKLPELARTLGRTMRQLRDTADEFKSELAMSSLDMDRATFEQEVRELKSIGRELTTLPTAAALLTPNAAPPEVTDTQTTNTETTNTEATAAEETNVAGIEGPAAELPANDPHDGEEDPR